MTLLFLYIDNHLVSAITCFTLNSSLTRVQVNESSISYFLKISNEPITWFAQGINVSIMRLGDQSYFFLRRLLTVRIFY